MGKRLKRAGNVQTAAKKLPAETTRTVTAEPLIVGYGRQYKEIYAVREYHDSLVRAFRDRRADFVVLDDNPHGQRFLAAAIAWALDEGLVTCSDTQDDGQQVVSVFRLTPTGTSRFKGEA